MSNRRLTANELAKAHELLAAISKRIDELAGGDPELRFAYNRKVHKELMYVERGKPMQRRKLKELLYAEQGGKCFSCERSMAMQYSVLDRKRASLGYVAENVDLICQPCDVLRQRSKTYT